MKPPAATASATVEKILVRGVNWLGDAVMSIPALQRLREAKPDAHIALLAPEKLAGLWEGQPFFDELILLSPSDSAWQTGRRLREKRFTAGLAFPNSTRSALELWLAGIPRRVGLRRAFQSILLTEPLSPRPGARRMRKRSAGEIRRLVARGSSPAPMPSTAHHVYDYLYLAAALGASAEPLAPRLSIGQEEVEAAAARLGLASVRENKPYFGMNPGAEYGPAKRWPAESFVATAIAVHKATGCRWIIFGGPADREFAHFISTATGRYLPDQPVINLAGQTTLRELAGVLKSCRVLLTNDSGPMHLAAAVGTPVVVPFGSTSPEMTGPFMAAHSGVLRAPGIACAPCFRRECPIDFRCLRKIEVNTVVEAILRMAGLPSEANSNPPAA
jgi:lipopolysaccharide heptosyltransferase II